MHRAAKVVLKESLSLHSFATINTFKTPLLAHDHSIGYLINIVHMVHQCITLVDTMASTSISTVHASGTSSLYNH